MKQHQEHVEQNTTEARPFARVAARELTEREIEAISGGRPHTTNATGPNGDDPSDPGTYL
ncbi:hypothetical protein LDO26_05250 [Luteimonas sp. BDR2-5]|uniref:hypothetical protein n=1 Tax=Proluteimonas luteida TaxID=2878685 RepID=UPI001E4ED0B6|nr:hypothetical protein [Luteimonas sp. BDR2-5]MCD9027613.1 hypothetical protein [Luteimonas sp. BDR2-5]